MNSLVSVVIRTKNREHQLREALVSVFEQTHKNFEIIIIDNSDSSNKDWIESFFLFNNIPKDKFIYHRGISVSSVQSLNIGISKSNGEYISFLDDDDTWLPTKLEEQIKLIREKTAVLVICWSDDRRFNVGYTVKYPEKITREMLLSWFNLASTSCYLFDAEFLKNHERFDESFPSVQEYELAIRSSFPFSVFCVQRSLVIQNKSNDQITRDWKKKRQGMKLLLKKHKGLYMEKGIPSYIGFRLRFIGLQALYLSAELIGDRIYKIIIPMKNRRG